MTNQKGSLLVILLWMVSLLSLFAVHAALSTRQAITAVARLEEREALSGLAFSGTQRTAAALKTNFSGHSAQEPCGLSDFWTNNTALFASYELGQGLVETSYESTNNSNGIKEKKYGLVDEERKINLNKADFEVLRGLFQVVLGSDETQSAELAGAIVDWRDKDSQTYSDNAHNEQDFYQGKGSLYRPKNADFETIEELLFVPGMTPEISSQIKDYVTVMGSGKINLNTCSRIVLLSVGIPEKLADWIIQYRSGGNGIEGDTDDNVFVSGANVATDLSTIAPLPDNYRQILEFLIAKNIFGYTSENFMAVTTAQLNNKRFRCVITGIMNRQGVISYFRQTYYGS